MKHKSVRVLQAVSNFLLFFVGCGGQMDALDPKGSIGLAEKNLFYVHLPMLIVVVPFIFLTLYFA